MTEETCSIWLQNSVHNKKIHNLIKRYASVRKSPLKDLKPVFELTEDDLP